MSAVPWTGQKETNPNYGLPIRPNSPFYLTHHPESWDLVYTDDHPEWLPKLSKLVEVPGVQGVRQTTAGPDSSMAKVEAMERGCTVLPYEYEYLTRSATKGGGHFYHLVWNSPKQVAGRVFWKLDQEAYNNFRRSLLAEGLVEPLDPDLLQLQLEQEEQKLQRYIPSQHLPQTKQKMDELIQKMADMKKAAHPKKKRKK